MPTLYCFAFSLSSFLQRIPELLALVVWPRPTDCLTSWKSSLCAPVGRRLRGSWWEKIVESWGCCSIAGLVLPITSLRVWELMWDLEARLDYPKQSTLRVWLRRYEGLLWSVQRSFCRGVLRPRRGRGTVRTVVYSYEGVEIQAQLSCSRKVQSHPRWSGGTEERESMGGESRLGIRTARTKESLGVWGKGGQHSSVCL